MSAFVVMTLLLLLLRTAAAQESTLKTIVEREKQLTKLNKYMEATQTLTFLGNTAFKNITFFATHNLYFGRRSFGLDGTPPNKLNMFLKYHLVPRKVWAPEMMSGKTTKMKLRTDFENSFLFINKVMDKVFVNDAEILQANLQALNGRCHIINNFFVNDKIVLDVANGLNAFDFLKDDGNEVYRIFQTYHEYTISSSILPHPTYGSVTGNQLKNSDAFCTLFVPDNDVLHEYETTKADMLSRIKGLSPGFMKQVLESMVIPNFAYHVKPLLYLSANEVDVPAMRGSIRLYTHSNKVFVQNVCGKAAIKRSNIKTINCIVHYVDDFLGVVTNTTYWIIQTTGGFSDLSKLFLSNGLIKELLDSNGGYAKDIKADDKYTTFAPMDKAFRRYITLRDPNESLKLVKMWTVKGIIDLSLWKGRKKFETLLPGYFITIFTKGKEIWVEMLFVSAKVVETNICTLNGIIHALDQLPGVATSTLEQHLADEEEKSREFLIHMEETGLLTSLKNVKNNLTLFAVVQSAVENISPLFLGQQNKQKLKDLLARHMGSLPLFLHTIENGRSVEYQTFNGAITVVNDNGVYWVEAGGRRVKVLDWDMKSLNGVIHYVSDFFPYKPSSSMPLYTSLPLATTLLLIALSLTAS